MTPSEISTQSSVASDLRATATEFVPCTKGTPTANFIEPEVTPAPILPDMYALDTYGIPWFYHMYPVPCQFPPAFGKGRSRSPKKLRPRKQRLSVTSPSENQQAEDNILPSIETPNSKSAENKGDSQKPAATIAETCTLSALNYIKPSNGPFATQFDMVAHQSALQAGTNSTRRPPQIDLTSIRNVPVHDPPCQMIGQDYDTVPSWRWNHRQSANGLYGGRGNVGMPLYATIPFPDPVPPMGRPTGSQRNDRKAHGGYRVDAQACGTIEIEKAAEYGGNQACNTCEPDH